MSDQNKFFTLTILISLALPAGCQFASSTSATIACEKSCASDDPEIVFAETEHDAAQFGKIPSGAERSCRFEFINDGGKDLVIERIHASCGCTTTATENTTIKPGHASEISVTYRAGSAGKTKKQIIVYTNDPASPQV